MSSFRMNQASWSLVGALFVVVAACGSSGNNAGSKPDDDDDDYLPSGGSLGTSGSTSTIAGTTSAPLATSCAVAGDDCECSTNRDGGPAGVECSAAKFADTTCCAEAGFPTREDSSCACRTGRVGVCYVSEDKQSCGCVTAKDTRPLWAETWTPDLSCKLANTPVDAGDVKRCCMTADSSLCACSWTTFSCALNYEEVNGVPAHEVPSCTFSDVKPGCEDGQTALASCSNPSAGAGGSSSGSGGSNGSGSGSGGSAPQPTCSPTYGECEDSGDCSCGQSCFASAVCSTCAKRCGYSCITDQDCLDLQEDRNLSVGYTRCEKTSPNFEIYKCE